jgi:hypothetical protein
MPGGPADGCHGSRAIALISGQREVFDDADFGVSLGLTAVIRVAVNVSPLQLRWRDFVDRVLRSNDSSGSGK